MYYNMIRALKKITTRVLTFFNHSSVLKGPHIVIRKSTVSHQQTEIFGNVLIQNAAIGESCKIYGFSVVTNSSLAGNNKVGNHCTIDNSTVGLHSYIADFAMVNNTTIGKYCSVGPGFKSGLGSHPHNFISTSPFFYHAMNTSPELLYQEYERTWIGNDVWVGANVFIKDGVTVGDGAIIAAGAVVLKDVSPYAIMGGVPAKVIRYRHDADTIATLTKIKWWDRDAQWIAANISSFQKIIASNEDLNTLIV